MHNNFNIIFVTLCEGYLRFAKSKYSHIQKSSAFLQNIILPRSTSRQFFYKQSQLYPFKIFSKLEIKHKVAANVSVAFATIVGSFIALNMSTHL